MTRTGLAIVAAHLALEHICVCGHHHEKHSHDGSHCYACAGNQADRSSEECKRFVAVTALVTVVKRDYPHQSAGDLLCEAVDQWARHATRPLCEKEPCQTCDALFNRVRLAWKVWESSAYKGVSTAGLPANQELRKFLEAQLAHEQLCAVVAAAKEAGLL